MSGMDWRELRRIAAQEYERSGEGHRRREAGSQATAQAEELAWWARHMPDVAPVALGGYGAADADAVRAAALAADQAVYVYRRGLMLAKLPPSTMWNTIEGPRGMELRTLLLSPSRGAYVTGPEWGPGEWTFCGRGHEGE